jgi:hypothetical protein
MAAGGLLFALLAPPAGTRPEPGTAPATPAEIQPPPGQVVLFRYRAEGVQIYEGKARADDPDRFEWSLKGPQADLFDEHGQKAGTHSAGPVWEAADGSKVRGKVKAKVDSPDANAVQWLLLEAAGHEGEGRMAKVAYVQRIDTWAGKPAADCTKADVGKEVRVKYEATYVFFGEKP